MRLLAGEHDEAFHAERYAALFQGEGSEVPVTLLPGVTHVGLILQPRAVQAIVSAVAELQSLQAVAQR
jgi:uncharacterized YccA/Bax inhibitor family protein